MWVSNHWSDYELIDCSSGEKLERWGKYFLVRPDPQVIWDTPRTHSAWSSFSARYSRSHSGGGSWINHDVPERWQIHYDRLTFEVGLMNFKHTGIFPEQSINWDFASELIQAQKRPIKVLSLFSYTGAATLTCAAAGASVCHVDAAKGMVQWAKKNAQLSGLTEKPIRWIVDDCVKFVEREIRRGHHYDAVIMDPPSFGRGPSGEIWKLDSNLFSLVELICCILSDHPLFVILNSYTTGLAPSVLAYVLQTTLGRKFGGDTAADEIGLPVTESGLILPCGATGRWISK